MASPSSTNSFSTLVKNNPLAVEAGKGTSRKARQRQRKAAQKAAHATFTVKPEGVQVSENSLTKSLSPPPDQTRGLNTPNKDNILPTKSGGRVLRLTNTDFAQACPPASTKIPPTAMKLPTLAPAAKKAKVVPRPTSPTFTQQMPSSAHHKDAGDYRTEKNGERKTAFDHKLMRSPSTSGGEQEHGKTKSKVHKPKVKPTTDPRGRTHLPITEKDASEKSFLLKASPKASTNPFSALGNEEDAAEAGMPNNAESNDTAGKKKKSRRRRKNKDTAVGDSGPTSKAQTPDAAPLTTPTTINPISSKNTVVNINSSKSSSIQVPLTSVFKDSQTSQTPLTSNSFPGIEGAPHSNEAPSERAGTAMNTQSWAQRVALSPPATAATLRTVTAVTSPKSKPALRAPPTDADFPATLPSSTPKTAPIPALSFASVARSSSSTSSSSTESLKGASSPLTETPNTSAPSSPSPLVEQKLDNLLEMIRPERQALLKGPHIAVYVGDKAVKEIAKRAAMAASAVLHEHFTEHPQSLEYRFPAGTVSLAAVHKLLISYMQHNCQLFEAEPVGFCKTFKGDLAVLRAARLLDMERYTKQILGYYVKYLKTSLPSYLEILAVEETMTSDKDPLWTGMVNHLTHLQFKGLIPDPDNFARFLEKHPKLKGAIDSADTYFKGVAQKDREMKDAERQANIRAQEEARNQRWVKNQEARAARIKREKQIGESLRFKFNGKHNTNLGVQTITQEEANYMRGY